MRDVEENYRLDRHCLSCNYVQLADTGVSVPIELYRDHYDGKGRNATSTTCSFLCKLELLLDALETEDDFNSVLGMPSARVER